MFGMGFTEILIILVIAILFLGPDKLPSALVDMAKLFRQVKKTVGSMKDSLDEEMNVSEIKEEALSYKKQLLEAQEGLKKVVDLSDLDDKLADLDSSIEEEAVNKRKLKNETVIEVEEEAEEETAHKEEVVTFKKKTKENKNV